MSTTVRMPSLTEPLQAVICAVLADIIIHYLKRAGINLNFNG